MEQMYCQWLEGMDHSCIHDGYLPGQVLAACYISSRLGVRGLGLSLDCTYLGTCTVCNYQVTYLILVLNVQMHHVNGINA